MAKKFNPSAASARFAQLGETVEQEQQSVEFTNLIPIDSIVINQDNIFNVNDDEDSIIELAKNIEENGLLHNIVVAETEPNKYLLISGERRTRAYKYLGRDKIKATVRKNLTELEILKMLFFANSETREYTIEEKVQIIEGFLAKIKQFENTSEREAAKKFKEYVAQAFNVSERQANKLISITSELIMPLKELLYSDAIDINTAATLAQLPENYQEYAIEIIKSSTDENDMFSDSDKKKYAIEHALDFARRAKNIISKTNTLLTKEKTSKLYYNGRLTQAQEELNKVMSELNSPDISQDQLGELTARQIETEKTVAKIKSNLEQIDKEIEVGTQKQNSEVKKVYDNTVFSIDKGLDDVHKDKTGKVAQSKKIAKEIQAASVAIKRLLDMNPSEELKTIQGLLEEYKNKNSL